MFPTDRNSNSNVNYPAAAEINPNSSMGEVR